MRIVDRLEAGTALLAGIALIIAAAGVLVTEPNHANRDDAGQLRTGASGLLPLLFSSHPATPGIGGSIYGGYSAARDSDIILQQPNGTDMVLKDVSWNSEPDKMPPYHGFRGTWWFPLGRAIGATADLVYIKVVANQDHLVRQSGTRDGIPVPGKEPVSATFRRLEFTDGLNLLTGGIIYRMPFFGRVMPYIGIGAGLSLPHAEVQRSGAAQKTFSYQWAGFAFHVFAGVEYSIAKSGSLFTEYRLSYATNKVALIDGGTLKTNLWVNHFAAGGTGYIRPALGQGGN